jgi:hypothetical protein
MSARRRRGATTQRRRDSAAVHGVPRALAVDRRVEDQALPPRDVPMVHAGRDDTAAGHGVGTARVTTLVDLMRAEARAIDWMIKRGDGRG